MAVYKVPQDVEADDKFFGPFSFKQFIFFGGVGVCGYLVFLTATKGVWPLSIVFALPMIVFGFLAFPWSKDQPTELWLAAHIRFLFMKRKRIWDQSGMKDLVTITAPKREVHALTDGLSQDEVRTRFNALASVVDSRGWAVKNISSVVTNATNESDRLVQAQSQSVTEEEIVNSAPDIMDEKSNPLAQQFDSMIEESKSKHHKETLDMIQEARQSSDSKQDDQSLPDIVSPKSSTKKTTKSVNPNDLWFLNQNSQAPTDPNLATFKTQAVVKPGQEKTSQPVIGMGVPVAPIKQEDEQKLLDKVHKQKQQEEDLKQHSHLKTIQPMSAQTQQPDPVADDPTSQNQDDDITAQASVQPPMDPAILNLAINDDLNIETIARQAKKDMPDEGEVVISLH